MTIPTITCELFAERLADYLESDADATTRAALDAHAARCAGCGALLADLRRLRTEAAALPALAPERDLWAGIAARIETPVVEIAPGGHAAPWTGRRRLNPLWMGIAAAALVAVTATITQRVTRQPVATPPGNVAVVTPPAHGTAAAGPAQSTDSQPANAAATTTAPANATTAAPTPSSTRLASNRLTPDQTYDMEIARLRAIIAQRRSGLDTATINVIERNLKVIDDAIAQCRAALRKDPASRFLLESLNDALDTKIQLLRTAATLPTRA